MGKKMARHQTIGPKRIQVEWRTSGRGLECPPFLITINDPTNCVSFPLTRGLFADDFSVSRVRKKERDRGGKERFNFQL